jgi:hypothetical protein
MATGDPFAYYESNDYYRVIDQDDARQDKSYALDVYPLIQQVGLRVILIEEIDGVRYGVMDGVVVKSNEKFVLIIKDLSDDSLHRFPTPANFDWYQNKYFMKSSWLRRRRHITKAALELRDQTYQLFDTALAKGIYRPDEVDAHRDSSDWALRWNLASRLDMPVSSSWSDLMSRLQGM